MKTFAELEREFVRERVLPDFEFEWFEKPSRINPLRSPIHDATVAIVATSGVYVKDLQPPFSLGKGGDASYREIPADISLDQVGLAHVGYDTKRALEDPNVVFPLDRLREAEEAQIIGEVAPRHFSFMGYSPQVQLLMTNAREVANCLSADQVDLVLLIPV